MVDREKVIKVLEYCVLSDDCRACEYLMEFDDTGCKIMKDTLVLLKEQEAVEPTWHPDIRMWECGACCGPIRGSDKHCPECGRKIKWGA